MARARDHEPPAAPATAAVLLGGFAFLQGLILPAEGVGRHLAIGFLFGGLGLLSAWRAVTIGRGRRHRGARRWAWAAAVLGLLGVGMLGYQGLVILTGGALPPPFWWPYAQR
ncbi:hypothetical protein DEJ33_08255 [Curtobacterium sp. MCPF17_047]|uniref:hypothetical protein n=1 Tax=Curtobacterium sp. MCPF17_047 TaxID=2175654 RepID=UPI000DA9CA19|nr:hypothetical protein [Curtobacterium sp. MCPF17_047]PZF66686.1 hypothetical protein DEJ33_08255 [Curtobacterium sp. MCPF17_047]